MKKITYEFEIADIPDVITPERLAEHKKQILAHVEATVDAHHEALLTDDGQKKEQES
jgi:hypothetical protein